MMLYRITGYIWTNDSTSDRPEGSTSRTVVDSNGLTEGNCTESGARCFDGIERHATCTRFRRACCQNRTWKHRLCCRKTSVAIRFCWSIVHCGSFFRCKRQYNQRCFFNCGGDTGFWQGGRRQWQRSSCWKFSEKSFAKKRWCKNGRKQSEQLWAGC